MVEAIVRPRGPYSLRLTTGRDVWSGRFPGERWARAAQLGDGTLAVEASCERGLADARFVLCADDDTTDFHRAFARDPLLGPTVRTLRGMRPKRRSTVTHATVRAICGQLIQARRALEIERAIIRACGESPPTQEALARLSPARLTACGLAASRSATLVRLARTHDLEGLRSASRGCAHAVAPRARRRRVDGGRDRAPGPRPLRHGARRRSRAGEAPRVPARPLARRPARRPSSSRRTASGRGSRASSCCRGSSEG